MTEIEEKMAAAISAIDASMEKQQADMVAAIDSFKSALAESPMSDDMKAAVANIFMQKIGELAEKYL